MSSFTHGLLSHREVHKRTRRLAERLFRLSRDAAMVQESCTIFSGFYYDGVLQNLVDASLGLYYETIAALEDAELDRKQHKGGIDD